MYHRVPSLVIIRFVISLLPLRVHLYAYVCTLFSSVGRDCVRRCVRASVYIASFNNKEGVFSLVFLLLNNCR